MKLALPVTLSVEGLKLPGLKFGAVNVPLIVAFPATLKFPPRFRLNAEMSLPDPEEDVSAGRITSGFVIVPVMPGPEICTSYRPAGA